MAFRHLAALMAFALTFLAFVAPAHAGVRGGWTVEADEPNNCLASLEVKGGAGLLLLGTSGELAFGVLGERPLARGKAGVIATEAYSFAFEPNYSKNGEMLYTVKSLGGREVAALRLAKSVKISVDAQTVLETPIAGDGLGEVLDALVACSQGEAGWWGKGAQVSKAKTAAAEPAEPALNKEGVWSLQAREDACLAVARKTTGTSGLVLIAANAGADIMVGVGGDNLKRGRKGLFETDGYSFPFKPDYDGKDYMQLDSFLDSQALFTLRRAKAVYISVDGKEVFNANLENTGIDALITDLVACGKGQAGWWGEGAAPRR